MSRLKLYLWLGVLSFTLGVTLCVWLDPSAVFSHAGISYYGNLRRTLIPYGIGLVLTAYFLLRAALIMKSSPAVKSFRVGIEGLALALFGIVATPSLAPFILLQDLHVLFGIFIFVVQAALSLRFLIMVRGEIIDWFLLTLQLIAIAVAGLSFYSVGVLNLMLPAQLLAVTAFSLLLIRAASYRVNQDTSATG